MFFYGGGNLDLTSAIEKFLTYCKEQKKFSQQTVITYTTALEQFKQLLEGELEKALEVQEVTAQHIKRFISYLHHNKMSKKTLKVKASAIKSFFKFLYKKDLIASDPSYLVATPKIEKNIPSFLLPNEIEALIDGIEPKDPISSRNLALIELLYSSGLRISEALNLTTNDFNRHSQTLRIVGKGNKERIVPIGKKAIEAISKYIEFRKELVSQKEHSNKLFLTKSGKPLKPAESYKIIHNLLTKFSDAPQRSPHVLRHTFATHLLDKGADIQSVSEMLGHSSLSSTQVYTHVSVQKLKEAYKKAHPKA